MGGGVACNVAPAVPSLLRAAGTTEKHDIFKHTRNNKHEILKSGLYRKFIDKILGTTFENFYQTRGLSTMQKPKIF